MNYVANAFRTKPALILDLRHYIQLQSDSNPADLLGQCRLTCIFGLKYGGIYVIEADQNADGNLNRPFVDDRSKCVPLLIPIELATIVPVHVDKL